MAEKYGLMLNIDINTVVTGFLNGVAEKKNFTKEDLYPMVDQYADTDITDILFCVFCQYSATESKLWSTYADKYEQKVENGVAVDYTKEYGAIYKLNRTYGADPYAIWIDRTRERGMRPWLSVRMNDCHYPDNETSFLRSDFFYEACEKGWMIGDRYGYNRYCFDYAAPEVRRRMLGYIREQLEQYDVFGIELDFQREVFCFDYVNTPDCHRFMTTFMREARQIVHEASEKWGHPIQLAARVTRDMEQSKRFGYDAVTWAKEGLIDLVVPTPHFSSNDDTMPIRKWKAALPGVAVQAGLEVMVNRTTFDAAITAEVARALSAKYLSKGSDGIYLFNHFLGHGKQERIDNEFHKIYRTCGSLEKALATPSRYVVMWQDTTPTGYTPYMPMPILLAPHEDAKALEIDLGIHPESCICTLTLGIDDGGAEDMEIFVNGEAVMPTNAGMSDTIGFCEPGKKLVCASLTRAEDAKYTLQMRAKGEKAIRILYAEIFVQP